MVVGSYDDVVWLHIGNIALSLKNHRDKEPVFIFRENIENSLLNVLNVEGSFRFVVFTNQNNLTHRSVIQSEHVSLAPWI